MKRKSEPGVNLTGNQQFEGYCKDLADLIAEKLTFTYELRLVKDGKYGGQSAESESGWNGMVGELIRNASTSKYESNTAYTILRLAEIPHSPHQHQKQEQ